MITDRHVPTTILTRLQVLSQESPKKIESRKGVAVYFLVFLPVYEQARQSHEWSHACFVSRTTNPMFTDFSRPSWETSQRIDSHTQNLKKKHIQSMYMQSNPRILVNSLVILVNILVNSLVKLAKVGNNHRSTCTKIILTKTPSIIPRKSEKNRKS